MKRCGTQVFFAVALFGMAIMPMRADNFIVTINTAPIQGQQGFLAFDFLSGSPVQNNVVTISGFSTNASLGATRLTGSAAGSLVPGPGTLRDSQFFNEILQTLTYGTAVSFGITLTTNASQGGVPDEFSLFLLNSSQNPYATSDPTGAGSLLTIDINGSPLSPQVFTSSFASVSIQPQAGVITPEPSTWLLSLTGTAAMLGSVVRRRHGNAVSA